MIDFKGLEMSQNFAAEAAALMLRKQQFADSECIRLMEPYTPMRTGTKIDIGATGTQIGSGVVQYRSAIARRNYYMNKGTGKEGTRAKNSRGLRGKLWFERMKADHKQEILKGAQNVK